MHYGRLKVIDSTLVDKFEKRINFMRLYPDVILRIRPEERFGGYLRYRPFKMSVPSNEGRFYSVSSKKEFLNNENTNDNRLQKRWMHRMELSTYYTPNIKSDNKFFFRYRYTTTSTWETNGYSEFQVGYLAYLKF